MPHELTKTVYYFDELSDAAKDRARDWYREASAGDNDFADPVIEDAARMAEMLGITFKQNPIRLMNGKTRNEPAIYWSGFSSQGDGACFEGSYSYRKGSVKAIAEEAPPIHDGKEQEHNLELNRIASTLGSAQATRFYRISAKIEHSYRGVHEHSTDITVYVGDDYADADTQEIVVEALRDFMRWIYRGLQAEYEYQNSDEVIDESIRANEYEFTEDGRRAC